MLRATISLGLLGVLLAAPPAEAQESNRMQGDLSYTRIQRGQYLVRAGDCAACHTDKKDQPFAGGRAIPTPFGTIYSTNITPDKETGIGNWTADDFYRAMHDGIRHDGAHLYPAMPYPWYTKMTREDVDAILAYLETVKPIRNQDKPTELPWPLSWRGGMAVWNKMFFDPGEYKTNPHKSAQWNRGAYLIEGAGHCGACHTAKNALGATGDDRLAGGDAGEHWYAPALTGDLRNGLGQWSTADIVTYLKTGATKHTAASGPMTDVIEDSTRYLSNNDLQAIAVYLKDMPAQKKSGGGNDKDVDSRRMITGAALYQDHCAACHMENGQGQPNAFPSLKGSSIVQAKKPDTIVHLILDGGKMAGTKARPTQLAMPAFDDKLDNEQVADLVTYLRNAWGNHAAPVDADAVKSVRQALAQK
ncbi:MAG: cytochrome c [Burkholderiaceae bacterium]